MTAQEIVKEAKRIMSVEFPEQAKKEATYGTSAIFDQCLRSVMFTYQMEIETEKAKNMSMTVK
jgi:hypothetical protein